MNKKPYVPDLYSVPNLHVVFDEEGKFSHFTQLEGEIAWRVKTGRCFKLIVDEPYDDGESIWFRPTAYAYAQVCKARNEWQRRFEHVKECFEKFFGELMNMTK